MEGSKPYGLILAGGKSSRMGTNKALLNYHGEPQVQWLNKILQTFCADVFVSGDKGKIPGDFKFIPDHYETGGPMNGILSAIRLQPFVAWLVVAVDMPHVDQHAISYLLEKRNEARIATCFVHPKSNMIEPLPVILELKAYPLLHLFFGKKNTSLNNFLGSSDTNFVQSIDPKWLDNINSPDEQVLFGP